MALTADPHFAVHRLYSICILSAFFPALILFGANVRLTGAVKLLAAKLGDLSYPLYVLHAPLLALLYGRRPRELALHSTLISHGLLPACLTLIAALSLLLASQVDAPLRRSLSRAYKTKRFQVGEGEAERPARSLFSKAA